MQAELRYFKHNSNHYHNKPNYYAIPVDLDPFEIVEKIQVWEHCNSSLLSSNGVRGIEDRFYLIYQWDWFDKCWVGTRSCLNYIREIVVDGEEMADLSLLITNCIPKLEVETP